MDPLDVVIPLAPESHSGWGSDMELKMGLRSIELHGSGVGRVVVLGKRRPWFSDQVVSLEISDVPQERMQNVRRKYRTYVELLNPDRPWIMWNDDFFLAAPFDFRSCPLWYDGTLLEAVFVRQARCERLGMSVGYTRYLEQTLITLGAIEIDGRPKSPILNFAVHVPVQVDPQAIRWALEATGPDVSLRVAHGRFLRRQGAAVEERRDPKLIRAMPPAEARRRMLEGPTFSIGDAFLDPNGRRLLEELYGERSRWEKST
jgi:hypothetical protein